MLGAGHTKVNTQAWSLLSYSSHSSGAHIVITTITIIIIIISLW